MGVAPKVSPPRFGDSRGVQLESPGRSVGHAGRAGRQRALELVGSLFGIQAPAEFFRRLLLFTGTLRIHALGPVFLLWPFEW